jgi:adenylate cyclase
MFVHALVPSAIYDSVRTLRRRKLHRKAAAAIEAIHSQDYESLAYHYGEAGDSKRALKYFTLAGERAEKSFANQDAERYFLSALDLVEDTRQEADLLRDLGIVLSYQNKYQQALITWRKAIDLYQELGESDKVAELYARSALTTWDDGDTKAGLEVARQGLAAAVDQPEGPGMARLLAETARECYFNGLHADCEKYGLQALQMAEKLSLPAIQADTLSTLGLLPRESPHKNVEYLEKAVEITEANNLLRAAIRAHNNLHVVYGLSVGDIHKSNYHVERAIEINKQVADPEGDLFIRSNLAGNRMHMGFLNEAARQI